MSKLVKLAKLVTSGAPITDRFMNSILDDSLLPNNIKKKAILYYRGDKRLSVPKFLDMISRAKVKRRVQKGGGWTFGSPITKDASGYKVIVHDGIWEGREGREGQEGRILVGNKKYTFIPPTTTPPPPPPFTFGAGSSALNLTNNLGSGSFASVFEIKDSEHVFKLFYQTPHAMFDAIETNLRQLIREHKDIATVFPHLPHHEVFIKGVYSTASDRQYNNFGYKMIKCSKDLKKALGDEYLLSYIDLAKVKLTDAPGTTKRSFVHGDIKLDNIMLQEETMNKYNVHISDWDGVYMYTYNLLSMDGPPAAACLSAATAHPYYIWFTANFTGKPVTFANVNTESTFSITNTWNAAFRNQDNATITMIKRIVDGLYGGSFEAHAIANMSNPAWHMHMLERCDRYSLGMSLLLCAKGAYITTDIQRRLMLKGADIVSEACRLFDPNSSGGRRKLIRGGGLQNGTNPQGSQGVLQEPMFTATAPKTPQPSISLSTGILAIVNEYEIVDSNTVSTDKQISRSDLDEYMKTIMIMPDNFELPPPPPPVY